MTDSSRSAPRPRPMNVHVARGSRAEAKYRAKAGLPGLQPEQIAPGVKPTPSHDLRYHGGRTIPALSFANFYVGGDAWQQSDVQAIDKALAAAMAEPTLNNVMAQYFSAPPTSHYLGSQTLLGPGPAHLSQGDVEALIRDLATQGRFAGSDLTSTVFNFLLPRGTILSDDPAPQGTAQRRGVPADAVDSLHGLGGYHGSVPIPGATVYYAVGVYSETANGQTNGIPAFDAPWKNVVATFYHELNETRTDPDVEFVIQGGATTLLGWTSRQGEECGDFPVFEASPLSQVFQEVPITGGGSAPVQFQYSNHVHGPEGPIPKADPPIKHRTPKKG